MADDGKTPDLERAGSHRDFVRKISRHQSSHFYQSIEQIRNFETMEDKCKNIVLDYLSQFEDENEEEVLHAIFDFVDIPPLNRKSRFEANFEDYQELFDYIQANVIQENKEQESNNNNNNNNNNNTNNSDNTNDENKTENKNSNENDNENKVGNQEISDAALVNIQKRIDFKWTIDETKNTIFPSINKNTLYGVYFADIQSQIVLKYQIAGCIRDANFLKKKDNIDGKNESWDPCWDIYFYLVCYKTAETQFKGSVCFSNFWSNMLIFGIDEDFIREACETGDWEFDAVNIAASPKKTSLMGRRMFLQKKPSAGADVPKDNKEEKNNNLLLANNSSVHFMDDSGMEMLRYLYDVCDIVTVENENENDNDNDKANDGNDKNKNENKQNEKNDKNEKNESKKSELFVVCDIKLSNNAKEEDIVTLLTKNGEKVKHPLRSLVTKHSIREQRDIDELKRGILPLSEKQLQFITTTKKFGSGDAEKS